MSGWPEVALGRLVRFGHGRDASEIESAEGAYPVIGSGGPFARSDEFLHDGESVLFGRKGTIDPPLYVSGRFWTVDTMYYTVPSASVVARWLYYWATTVPFGLYSTSTALPSMTSEVLGRLRVALPPLDTQRRIADFLDRETAKIDALIEKQASLIATLRERRASVIAQSLDVTRLLSGARLKHVVRQVRQGWSPQCNAWPAASGEWAVLRTGCVNGGRFDASDNKELPDGVDPRLDTVVAEGEVVLSRANTRDLVGSAGVVRGEHPRLMLSDKHYALRLGASANPEFVALALGTRAYRDLIELDATGASPSMQNITQETILNLPMVLPSRVEQDTRVVAAAKATDQIDVLISQAERFIALARERRAALITAAVTGQLDVATGKAAA